MLQLTGVGFFFWMLITGATYLLSGEEYYQLRNYWIPFVPLLIFALAWLAVNALKASVHFKKQKQTGILCFNQNLERIEKFHVRISAMMLAIMAGLTYYVLSALNISISRAQELRDAYFESLSMLGGSYFIWLIWLINSLIFYLLYMGIIFDICKKRPFSKTTILALILVIMYSLLTGGRIAIFSAAVIYIGAWLNSVAKIRLTKKSMNAVILTLVILLGPLIFQQINRSKEITTQLGEATLVKYFIGPIFALDQFIEKGNSNEVKAALGRVGVSFVGIDTIIVSGLLRGLLGLNIESAQAATSFYFHDGIGISNEVVMNAQYTAGGRFFIDFGLFGYIFLFSSMVFISAYFDIRSRRRLTIFSPVIFGLMFLSIIYSSRELLTDSPAFLLSFFWLLIMRSRINKSMNKVQRLSKICVKHEPS